MAVAVLVGPSWGARFGPSWSCCGAVWGPQSPSLGSGFSWASVKESVGSPVTHSPRQRIHVHHQGATR
eukprot:3607103-Pyramimonas_sp.AAC.1